jgi:hypothetical protein
MTRYSAAVIFRFGTAVMAGLRRAGRYLRIGAGAMRPVGSGHGNLLELAVNELDVSSVFPSTHSRSSV